MQPDTVLARIVQRKIEQNKALRTDFPDAMLEKLVPSTRSLATALATPQASFILECKKASPSKGVIRANFDPLAIASVYQRYAAAISVLTEPEFFQGSFHYLAAVARHTTVPVLCKDFIIDSHQIMVARYHGADAILLMLSILNDDEYRELAATAKHYQLDILTEVSDADEMQRAERLGANIIGINNRNLRDLSIDPDRSIELSAIAPEEALLVAESGFDSNTTIRRSAPYVDAFLVGSSLTACEDIDLACRRLLFGEHKVCGLTNREDALSAQAAGSVYGGLIFAHKSPRMVTLEQAQNIQTEVPSLNYVAVVVKQTINDVIQLAMQLDLSAIQLHGGQSEEFILELKQALSTLTKPPEIWYALNLCEQVQPFNYDVDRFVFDNGQGGTGKTFDWSLLTTLEINESCPPHLLAGGLSEHNIDRAQTTPLQRFDFNSGVELTPGRKDPIALQRVFNRLRDYGRQASVSLISKGVSQ